MDHGYLKPNMPALVKAGMGSTVLLPSESTQIEITPLEMNGKIHPGKMASEYGAYKIVGRDVSVKRFLYENASARIFTTGHSSIVISKWHFDKNAPSDEVKMAQLGVGIGKTLMNAAANTAQGDLVGSGAIAKGAMAAGKLAYNGYTELTKKMDINKAMSNPDKNKGKQFKNGLKQIWDNVSGNRLAVLISVLAPAPGIAKSYDTGLKSVTFSNVGAVLKGL